MSNIIADQLKRFTQEIEKSSEGQTRLNQIQEAQHDDQQRENNQDPPMEHNIQVDHQEEEVEEQKVAMRSHRDKQMVEVGDLIECQEEEKENK